MRSDDLKHNYLVQEMTIELRGGKGEYLHVFHYGRLLAEGIDESEAVKMIAATALLLESGCENGLRMTPSEIEEKYTTLPESDPRVVLKKILGML